MACNSWLEGGGDAMIEVTTKRSVVKTNWKIMKMREERGFGC
jgi:hypothetical protein